MYHKPFLLILILCLFFTTLPVCAQAFSDAENPGVEYVTGKVVEVLSEVEVDDQVLGRKNKKVRFKVAFPAHGEQPADTLEVEQDFNPEEKSELYPEAGKAFVFYREAFADGTPEYTLIDVQRFNHIGKVAFLAVLLLIVIGRWYGIKAILLGMGMLSSFFVFHKIGLPWFWKSFLTFTALVCLAPILTFGIDQRAKVAALAAFCGGLLTLLLIWFASLFGITTPAALLNHALILQMGAGLSYITIFAVRALAHAKRQNIHLRGRQLFKKAFVGGQTALEGLATLYLIFALGQILTGAYADGTKLGVLELGPVLTDMASLIFMFIGFTLTVPLSSYLATRLMTTSR